MVLQIPKFPGGSEVKASACRVGDLGSIPGSGRSPGEGNGNPLQYSCLENPMDRGAWWATVHRVAKSQTRLSYFTFKFQSLTEILWGRVGGKRAVVCISEMFPSASKLSFSISRKDSEYDHFCTFS